MYFDNVRPVLKEVPQILLKGIFHSHPKGEFKERHTSLLTGKQAGKQDIIN